MNVQLKYRFRLRTRTGLIVDRIAISARDQSEAERRLRMMYPFAEVLECQVKDSPAAFPVERLPTPALPSYEQLVGALISVE